VWPWPMSTWPWTSAVHRVSRDQRLCQIWAKSNNPLLSYWSCSNFSQFNFKRRHKLLDGSQRCVGVTVPSFGRTYGHHRCSLFCFRFRYFDPLWNAGGLKSSDVKNRGQISHFFDPARIIWKPLLIVVCSSLIYTIQFNFDLPSTIFKKEVLSLQYYL